MTAHLSRPELVKALPTLKPFKSKVIPMVCVPNPPKNAHDRDLSRQRCREIHEQGLMRNLPLLLEHRSPLRIGVVQASWIHPNDGSLMADVELFTDEPTEEMEPDTPHVSLNRNLARYCHQAIDQDKIVFCSLGHLASVKEPIELSLVTYRPKREGAVILTPPEDDIVRYSALPRTEETTTYMVPLPAFLRKCGFAQKTQTGTEYVLNQTDAREEIVRYSLIPATSGVAPSSINTAVTDSPCIAVQSLASVVLRSAWSHQSPVPDYCSASVMSMSSTAPMTGVSGAAAATSSAASTATPASTSNSGAPSAGGGGGDPAAAIAAAAAAGATNGALTSVTTSFNGAPRTSPPVGMSVGNGSGNGNGAPPVTLTGQEAVRFGEKRGRGQESDAIGSPDSLAAMVAATTEQQQREQREQQQALQRGQANKAPRLGERDPNGNTEMRPDAASQASAQAAQEMVRLLSTKLAELESSTARSLQRMQDERREESRSIQMLRDAETAREVARERANAAAQLAGVDQAIEKLKVIHPGQYKAMRAQYEAAQAHLHLPDSRMRIDDLVKASALLLIPREEMDTGRSTSAAALTAAAAQPHPGDRPATDADLAARMSQRLAIHGGPYGFDNTAGLGLGYRESDRVNASGLGSYPAYPSYPSPYGRPVQQQQQQQAQVPGSQPQPRALTGDQMFAQFLSAVDRSKFKEGHQGDLECASALTSAIQSPAHAETAKAQLNRMASSRDPAHQSIAISFLTSAAHGLPESVTTPAAMDYTGPISGWASTRAMCDYAKQRNPAFMQPPLHTNSVPTSLLGTAAATMDVRGMMSHGR